MKRLRSLAIAGVLAVLPGSACVARAATDYGSLRGVVFDPGHTPQMGAVVLLTPEQADGRVIVQLLTDQNGVFTGQRLRPGLYAVKVTLAGFLPAVEHHVTVTANLTTVLRIELDSVFTSLDQLRRPSQQQTESDDWKWVLRTSAATRPVLQFSNGPVQVADVWPNSEAQPAELRASIEMTNGSVHPGASTALAGVMATTVSYDKSLGNAGKLLIAGQMSYDQIAEPGAAIGAAVTSIWVPSGEFGDGPETMLVLRQVGLPIGGRAIRMGRLEHSQQMKLGGRLAIDYGAEYLMGIVGPTMTSSVRPHAHVDLRLSPRWKAAFSLATDPDLYGFGAHVADPEMATDALNTLPVLMQEQGRAVFEGAWHEETSIERTVGARGRVEGAAYHDYSAHQAVFTSSPGYTGEFPVGQLLASDAGAGGSWGTRAVYHEKISENVEVAGIYSWAGALAPDADDVALSDLHDMLRMRYRNSVAARISGRLPHLRTQFSAGYKWLDGPVVSRQDLFGEEALGIDPYLSVTLRQPLPCFRAGCRWELLANMRNLLSQGYVTMEGDGSRVTFEPVERSFRGGLSFQF